MAVSADKSNPGLNGNMRRGILISLEALYWLAIGLVGASLAWVFVAFDFSDKPALIPSPIKYGAARLLNPDRAVRPGGYVTIIIPSRRTRVCPAQVERIWKTPENTPIVNKIQPISTFVARDGKWHDFSLKLRVPPQVAGYDVVQLENRIYNYCDGKPTETALSTPVTIQIDNR